MQRLFCAFSIGAAALLCGLEASAQIDPEKRELVQVGFNQPLQGASPIAGYAFLYLNEPNFEHTNLTLRLAIAPVYLDGEIGLNHLLGPHTDLGIGFGGGGYADNYYDFYQGKYLPSQSFTGNSQESSVSVYHLFNPNQRIPLNGVLRVTEHYALYDRDTTAANFALPRDHASFNVRAGLRWGGQAPVLRQDLAMELSGWYEAQFRSAWGPYGFDGDRNLQEFSQLFWGRGLLIYTFPKSKQSIRVSLNGGGTGNADRLDAFRLGGDLPMAAEFPLTLPGYFYQELSARDYVAFSAAYSVPLDGAGRWTISPMGTAAQVDYLPGLEQNGRFNSGVGLQLSYRSKSGVWLTELSYGYGFEAIRSTGRGGQSIGIMCQIDLDARRGHPAMYRSGPNEPPALFQFLRNLF